MDDLRQIAETVADQLHADLKAGTVPRIGMDEIAFACGKAANGRLDYQQQQRLFDLTVRRVIEKV